ncbi:MAG TPA: hypothetical protein VGE01_14440 [Fimbriimonas sp.]
MYIYESLYFEVDDGAGPEQEGSHPPFPIPLSRPTAAFEGATIRGRFSPHVFDAFEPDRYSIRAVPLAVNSVDVVTGGKALPAELRTEDLRLIRSGDADVFEFSMRIESRGGTLLLPVTYLILVSVDGWSLCGAIDVYPNPDNYRYVAS